MLSILNHDLSPGWSDPRGATSTNYVWWGSRLGTGGLLQCDRAWAANYHQTWEDIDGLDSGYCLDAPSRLPAGSTVASTYSKFACYSSTAPRE